MIAAIVEAILSFFAGVIEAIAGFFVAGAEALGAGEIIAIVLLFCVELVLWAIYGVFELLRAVLQRRKPQPVPRPTIWRPAKLRAKRQSNPGGDSAPSQNVSAQPNQK